MDPLFLTHLIARLDLRPSPWRSAFFTEWARHEATPGWINNPLATTEPAPELRSDAEAGFGPGKWNTANGFGVGIFTTAEGGATATARTLGNGRYPNIHRALAELGMDAETRANVVREVHTWGTHGFAEEIAAGWGSGGEPGAVEPTDRERITALELQVAQLNTGVLRRFGAISNAAGSLAGAAAAAHALAMAAADAETWPA